MLEFVQHSGCLDVPGAAACALARGKNEGGVPFVLDPHDITLQDDLWHAAFAGNVDIVTALVGPEHRNAAGHLIGAPGNPCRHNRLAASGNLPLSLKISNQALGAEGSSAGI